MRTALAVVSLIVCAIAPAMAEDRQLAAKTIGMMRLAVHSCDIGLTQDLIDIFQSGVEAIIGEKISVDIFKAQQAETPAMLKWTAAEEAQFCAITADLAKSLKIL